LRSSVTTKKRSFADLGAACTCLAACALSACDSTPRARPKPAATSTAEPAAAASVASGSGDTARTLTAERVLAEVRRLGGKGTLVNAWASWCGPCKHEIPMLARLANDLGPKGVQILLVSLDEPTDHEKAVTFLQERGITLPLYFAARPLGPFKQGMNPRWPGMLPASFLFDASGKLRYYWGGEAFEEELTPVLAALVAGAPIEGESDAKVAPEGEVH
jgi:thiol-disulfide isomerase/thioredoxin